MKKTINTGLVLLLVAALSACSSYNYYTAARNKTDLSAYRTFAWLPPATMTNKAGAVVKKEVADERVKDAAISALENKGLKFQENNPDLLVSYTTVTGRGMKTEFYPYYYGGYPGFGLGFGWGWGGGWGYRPFYGYGGWGWGYPYGYGYGGGGYARVPYKEGTLIIDIMDTKSRKLVWRGFGVGELHNPQKTVKELPKVVNGIIEQLQLNQVQQDQVPMKKA
ncbi:DUF4136 domain-containing protein [Mucilaginibacter rubeus]|uniref:DUF4136 domain-containing protein n=1 Tax=Mucilaginibacter rubeus TaxID=2027860 RepID=A0AAE6JFI8_9SPHI|nr:MULTISPECIES: DUF4136 domain-containing protein [Mucilaginibacter]QEM04600.1 DUF4136 domain-containing protein [Mucilaginibacter rubeus]QEM17193.1 DUF4136 domain-containing protein [Mucilaginibacter gossypii]QTE46302.1 DUF4136 domain-containing protein [Mucilaginibacter rubeus]QTE52899.1 DUF4136 domain-containing protein [Mucilaginibacter rubeus]QTE57985.1 DUF4136 domain-containing protein [Mucilaginibacter rubeus]